MAVSGFMLLYLLLKTAVAHSWVEEIWLVADDGRLLEPPGRPRSFVPRTSPDFLTKHDTVMIYLLPHPDEPRNEVSPADRICMSSPSNQGMLNYTTGPILCARRGSRILLKYQENGHVSLLRETPGKISSGKVFVYGTTDSGHNDKFLNIHGKWNSAGTGGDKRGRLLTEAPFDDGECYQAPSSKNEVYETRRQRFPPDPYHGEDRWCKVAVVLPPDYDVLLWTLYWVWDWPTQATAGNPKGKQQIYTTCMDVCMIE